MTGIQDDLATLTTAISGYSGTPLRWPDRREVLAALARVEAEIARLEQGRDDWHQLFIEAMEKTVAAEAEVARLRDGLRRLAVGEGNAMLLARALLAEDDATLSKVSPNDSNDLDFGGAS